MEQSLNYQNMWTGIARYKQFMDIDKLTLKYRENKWYYMKGFCTCILVVRQSYTSGNITKVN